MFGKKNKPSFKSQVVEALQELKPDLLLHDEDDYVVRLVAGLSKDMLEISKRLNCDPGVAPFKVSLLKSVEEEKKDILTALVESEKKADKLNMDLRDCEKALKKARKACESKRKELRRLNIYDDKEIEREYLKRKHLKPGASFEINSVNMVIDCLEYNEKDGEAVYFFDTRNDDLITSKMSVDAVLGIMGVYDV